jgi:hypothetical protein
MNAGKTKFIPSRRTLSADLQTSADAIKGAVALRLIVEQTRKPFDKKQDYH